MGLRRFGLARGGIGLVLACVVCAAAAAYAFSASQRSQYSASAQLLFRDPGFDQKLFGNVLAQPSIDPGRTADTNFRLVTLQTIADDVAKGLSGRLTGAQVSHKIQVAPQGRSDLVAITATDVDPRFAALLANSYATAFIAFRRRADTELIQQAQNLVNHDLQSVRGGFTLPNVRADLEQRSEQLGIVSSLQSGNAELVQTASPPTEPSGPHTARNAALGGFLGLMLGLAVAYIRGRLDHRLRSASEIEDVFPYPILASVPNTKALAGYGEAIGSSGAVEAFRALRANIRYFNVSREIRTLLIVSASAQEGKSTVAYNLARTSAEAGSRTLLVEADLRRPVAATRGDLPTTLGLSDLLSGNAGLAGVVQPMMTGGFAGANGAPPATPARGTERGGSMRPADVIVAGGSPPNPANLLESAAMRELIQTVRATYDLVIIDSAPMGVVADITPLIREVDGVLVIGRIDHSRKMPCEHLRDQLERLAAPVLGVVVNGRRDNSDTYGGYSYESYTSRIGERVT